MRYRVAAVAAPQPAGPATRRACPRRRQPCQLGHRCCCYFRYCGILFVAVDYIYYFILYLIFLLFAILLYLSLVAVDGGGWYVVVVGGGGW